MSIQAVAWVLENSNATLADRLVLIAIANHADARGWNAYPAIPLIALEAKVAEATVHRAVKALEESGELEVHRRPGRSNMYAIAALKGSQIERGHPSQIERGHPSQIERGPLSSTRKTPLKLRPEPLVTKSLNARAGTRADATLPPELTVDVRARGAKFVRALRTGE